MLLVEQLNQKKRDCLFMEWIYKQWRIFIIWLKRIGLARGSKRCFNLMGWIDHETIVWWWGYDIRLFNPSYDWNRSHQSHIYISIAPISLEFNKNEKRQPVKDHKMQLKGQRPVVCSCQICRVCVKKTFWFLNFSI